MLESLYKLYAKMGREYKSGSVIFLESQTGDEMYLIVEGLVQITKQYRETEIFRQSKLHFSTNVQVLAQLTKGDFFGEMALLNDKVRSATAAAVSDTKVIVITKDTFEIVIKHSNDMLYQILKSLSNRIRESNKYMKIIPEEDSLPIFPVASKNQSESAKEKNVKTKELEIVNNKKLYCHYCRADIEEKDIYCWQCGKKLYTTIEEND